MEIARGGGPQSHQSCRVVHATDAAAARRTCTDVGRRAGLAEADLGRVAVVATELATNLVKHAAEGGDILARGYQGAVQLLAVDRGPGIRNVQQCLEDGYSTAGSAGTGLGAIRRMSDTFDLYSSPGGSVVLAMVGHAAAGNDAFQFGSVSTPHPGETHSGDAWVARMSAEQLVLLVVDGLGHGPLAADSAAAATSAFTSAASVGPAELLDIVHGATRATRGAAAAVATVHAREQRVDYAGVGNIVGSVVGQGTSRQLVSMNGTLGHGTRAARQFTYPWTDASLLVMHSDGLSPKWDLDSYPGLTRRHPMLIAAVLWRDHRRGRDDATVVVTRHAP